MGVCGFSGGIETPRSILVKIIQVQIGLIATQSNNYPNKNLHLKKKTFHPPIPSHLMIFITSQFQFFDNNRS